MNDRFGKELLICDVCGEPLERMFPEGKQTFGWDRHPRKCLCQRNKDEKEEKDRLRREYENNLSRNRSICFPDRAMYEWNFTNDDGSVIAMSHARNYADHFEEMREKQMGLLFWGGVGTGKSFMAGCIANALLEKEYTVKMTNFAAIINDLFCCEDKNKYIESLMRFSLLIIDDLGAERGTEYAVENVFNVIDRRFRSGKPLIVTSNLHLDMLKDEPGIDKKRMYDRVLEMCVPIRVDGLSKRVDSAKEKMKRMKALNEGINNLENNSKEGEMSE